MARKKETFENVLIEAIDEALASLGESSKQSIYFHLQDRFKIAKEEVPNRLEEFAEGLEKIFGLGAQFLEILIMKNVYEKTHEPLEWNKDKELKFTEYVEAAKQSFLKRKEVSAIEM